MRTGFLNPNRRSASPKRRISLSMWLVFLPAFLSVVSAQAAEDTPPEVAGTVPSMGAVVHALGSIEVYFDEAVTGVDAADLLINGMTACTNVVAYAPNDYQFYFPQPPAGTVSV